MFIATPSKPAKPGPVDVAAPQPDVASRDSIFSDRRNGVDRRARVMAKVQSDKARQQRGTDRRRLDCRQISQPWWLLVDYKDTEYFLTR